MEFKVGDKVRTRSGGPAMTVERWEEGAFYWEDAGWRCCWFVQDALRRARFKPEVLELVPDDQA